MTKNEAFLKYQPDADTIYEVLSASLMGDYEPGMWLTESRVPLNFSCPNCGKASINLVITPFDPWHYFRTSAKLVQTPFYRASFPWTIQCPYCYSIYDIHTGWVEPNNGRMITTLIDIREIKPNPEIRKFASESFHWSGDKPLKYLTNYQKYLLALKIELEGFSLALQIENTLGFPSPEKTTQVELFAPNLLDSSGSIVSRLFAEAAKAVLPALSARGSKMNTSFGLILSEIGLLYSDTSVPVPFLTASQNAQLAPLIFELLDIVLSAANEEERKRELVEAGFVVKDLLI